MSPTVGAKSDHVIFHEEKENRRDRALLVSQRSSRRKVRSAISGLLVSPPRSRREDAEADDPRRRVGKNPPARELAGIVFRGDPESAGFFS